MWSRRRVLGASAGLAAALVAGGCVTSRPAAGGPPTGAPIPDADAARRAGWTVVTDFGAVGDGRSRPLSSRYASLAAARRDFPAATAPTDEIDGLAMQAAIDSGTDRVYYPPGRFLHDRALVVRDGQRHLGAGRGSTLVNVRRRDSALDDALAHSFEIGDIHPVAMVPGDPAQSWSVHRLASVDAGSRTVVVPDAPVTVRPGEIVMVRSDGPPTRTGRGVVYDFQMWNRVTGVDPAGATVALELPVPRDIVASPGSPTVLSGPRLCVNAGSDTFLGRPWSIVQDVEIGHLYLDSAGLTARNGVWRGWFHDLVIDAENMVTFNALVRSVVERVSGTWSARMIEVKHSSHDTVVRDVAGEYRRGRGGGRADGDQRGGAVLRVHVRPDHLHRRSGLPGPGARAGDLVAGHPVPRRPAPRRVGRGRPGVGRQVQRLSGQSAHRRRAGPDRPRGGGVRRLRRRRQRHAAAVVPHRPAGDARPAERWRGAGGGRGGPGRLRDRGRPDHG